ncbi:hypothetical protein HY408_02120 [Candidatus Gottesmanbacteria bacterium]|nr:hypothetical protein [Candidatus Gottesmanbacteria bacterium]
MAKLIEPGSLPFTAVREALGKDFQKPGVSEASVRSHVGIAMSGLYQFVGAQFIYAVVDRQIDKIVRLIPGSLVQVLLQEMYHDKRAPKLNSAVTRAVRVVYKESQLKPREYIPMSTSEEYEIPTSGIEMSLLRENLTHTYTQAQVERPKVKADMMIKYFVRNMKADYSLGKLLQTPYDVASERVPREVVAFIIDHPDIEDLKRHNFSIHHLSQKAWSDIRAAILEILINHQTE